MFRAGYLSYVLLPPELEVTIEDIWRLLEDIYRHDRNAELEKVAHDGRQIPGILVKLDDWVIEMEVNRQYSVVDDARMISAQVTAPPEVKARLQQVRRRIEIGTDIDREGKYFSDYMLLLATLKIKLQGAILYDPRKGELINTNA